MKFIAGNETWSLKFDQEKVIEEEWLQWRKEERKKKKKKIRAKLFFNYFLLKYFSV